MSCHSARAARVAVSFAVAVALGVGAAAARADEPPVQLGEAQPMGISTDVGPSKIVAADLDGDGDPDLALAHEPGAWTIQTNAGIGYGSSFTVGGMQSAPTGIAAGDVDGDGDIDVVLATGAGVEIARNGGWPDGFPEFPFDWPALSPGQYTTPTCIALADHTGDGRLDLIVGGNYDDGADLTGGGFVAVMPALAGGGYGTPTLKTIGLPVTAVAAADMNGDGRAEIAAALDEDMSVWFFSNPGDGTLGQEQVTSMPHHPRSILIGDATRDGRPDVVTTGWEDYYAPVGQNVSTVVILRQSGPTSPVTTEYFIRYSYSYPSGPDAGRQHNESALADLNGDDKPEIVSTAGLERMLIAFTYDVVVDTDGPVFLPGTVFRFPTASATPTSLAVALMDGDTKRDVVVACSVGPRSMLLVNEQDGGGGGGLPAATGLVVKSKQIGEPHTFQSGNKFTFSCRFSSDNPDARPWVESTTDPGDESSWAVLPGTGAMIRKGTTDLYKLTTFEMPTGSQHFRVVTRADGLPHVASSCIGPFDVLGRGAVLELTAEVIPAADPAARLRTYPGDTVVVSLKLRNRGDGTARNIEILTAPPKGTTLLYALPTEGFSELRGTLFWQLAALGGGESETFTFIVQVNTDARGPIVLRKWKVDEADDVVEKTRVPANPIELELGSPLEVEITPQAGEAQVGGTMSWLIRATNLGTATYEDAVVQCTVPRGTAYVDARFANADGSDAPYLPAPAFGRGNPHVDSEKGLVYWYPGELDGGESVYVRLDTLVRSDVNPGATIEIGSQLRASPPGVDGDPLKFDSLQASSGSATFASKVLSLTPPAATPELRVDQWAFVPGRELEVSDPRRGSVATVQARGEIVYTIEVTNEGGAAAKNCRVKANLPYATTLTPGSVYVGRPSLPNPVGAVYRISGDGTGTLDVEIQDVQPGEWVLVTFKVDVATYAKTGTLLETSSVLLTSDSLTGVRFAAPSRLSVKVCNPLTLRIDVFRTGASKPVFDGNGAVLRYDPVQQLEEGTVVHYVADLFNAGDIAGIGGVATLKLPKGTRLWDDPNVPDDGVALLTAETHEVVETAVADPNAKSVSFSVPLIGLGDTGRVRMSVLLVKVPPKGPVLCEGTFTGRPIAGKAGGTETSSDRDEAEPKRATRASLSMIKLAPIAIPFVEGLVASYTVVVANKSDVDAQDVVVSMTAPDGTEPHPQNEWEFTGHREVGRIRGNTVVYDIGTVRAHEHATRTFFMAITMDARGSALLENSCLVSSANADPACAGPTWIALLETDSTWKSFSWQSVGAMLESRGMKLAGANLPALSDQIGRMATENFSATTLDTDILQLANGSFVMPIGGGNIVAAGAGNIVAAGGLNFSQVSGAGIVAAGAGNLITIRGVGSFGDLTGTSLLGQAAQIVAAGAGNIVAAGGGNLIGMDGASLIGADGATLIGSVSPLYNPAMMVAAGGGNIVAAGGGNIVAAGAGNLIGADGATLIPRGGWIVAAGAGNIVAAGAGNIVGAGAGN